MSGATAEVEWSSSGDGSFSDVISLSPIYSPGDQDISNGSVILTLSSVGGECNAAQDELTIQFKPELEATNFSVDLEDGFGEVEILTEEDISNGFTISIKEEPVEGDANINGGIIQYRLNNNEAVTDQLIYELSTDCFTVEASITFFNDRGGVSVYNVITPNADGHHDFLKIENIESYPDNELMIFDRAGNVVYSTAGYSNENPFDGTNDKGRDLTEGNYFYRLKIPELQLDESGFILIKR